MTRSEATAGGSEGEASHRRMAVDGRADILVAVGLVVLTVIPRYALPVDGLFFDDAWQATAAVRGSPAELAVVGQTQPGFTFLLMVSVRIFGSGDLVLVAPALIAGSLGPASLYLVLRWMKYPRPVAGVLGAALLASHAHAAFSGRVKTYTTDVLIVLLLVVVVDRVAARRWGWRTTIGWMVGSVAVASFSSFGLVLTACAGVILVLHPQGDRIMRMAGVAVQGAVSAALFLMEQASHDGPGVAEWFTERGGMIGHQRPAEVPLRVLKHLYRVTESYTGGPGWLVAVLTVVALLGLLRLVTVGSRRTVGRFLLLVVVVAVIGSILGRVPLGGSGFHMARAHIWMFPVLAVGMASAAEAVAKQLPFRPRSVIAAAVTGVAVVVLVAGVRRDVVYPPQGARAATATVMRSLRPDDVVWIDRLQLPAFALAAGTPYELAADAEKLVGFAPDFEDRRLFGMRPETTDEELVDTIQGARRVRMISMRGLEDEAAFGRAVLLVLLGFEVVHREHVGGSTLLTLTR